MARRPSRFLAVDIGSSTIKLAEFARSKTGGLQLLNFHYGEIGGEPTSDEGRSALITQTLQEMLREKKIKPAPTVVSVSGQQVFTRYTKLPPVEPDKIAEIVRYEAQQNVPIPIDELVWDYQVISPEGAAEMEIVLVAIKTNLVEELALSVEAAGLRVNVVDVAPLALLNSLRYNYGDPQTCVVLADIGGRNTNLVFVEQNRIYSRSFPVGGNTITQAIATEYEISFGEAEQKKREQGFIGLGAYTEPENEEQARLSQVIRSGMNRLEGELRRTINLYRTQLGGNPPTKILLSGATSTMPSLDQYFRDKYPNAEVEHFNPFRNIELANGVPQDQLAVCAPFYGEVVGLGLRQVTRCPMEVNLLPPSIKAAHLAAARRPWLYAAVACVVLTLGVWWGYTWRSANLLETEVERLKGTAEGMKRQDETIHKAESEVKKIRDHIEAVKSIVEANDFWPKLLQDFNDRVQPYTWIEEFRPFDPAVDVAKMGDMPFRGGTPPASAAGTAGAVYVLVGKGVYDPLNIVRTPHPPAKVVGDFQKRLKDSPFVDPNSLEVIEVGTPKQGEFLFTFRIKVGLKKPDVL